MTSEEKRIGSFGNSSDGMVEMRRSATRSGPSGAALEVRVSQYHRDRSPGVEYPAAQARVLLDCSDLAALRYLCERRLKEIVGDDPERLQRFYDKAYEMHRPLEEKLAEFRASEAPALQAYRGEQG